MDIYTYSDIFVNFGLFDCSAIKNKPVQVMLYTYKQLNK